MTTKRNPDYSKSAINEADQSKALSNPPETRSLYDLYRAQQSQLNAVLERIEELTPPKLKEIRADIENKLVQTRKELENAIKTYGGFQDIENGEYALLQGKKSINYNAEQFRDCYPKLAQAVLIEKVDENVLLALIKADTLSEKKLVEEMVITYKKLSPTVIIK